MSLKCTRSMKSAENSIPDPRNFALNYPNTLSWLEEHAARYNHPAFILDDPISVPHQFSKLQDIEIAGFFTAIMAWGQRKTIISKGLELMRLMDNDPHAFISGHAEKERRRFLTFKHRTLQPDDILFLVDVLQQYYRDHHSLEDAFVKKLSPEHEDMYFGLTGFYDMVFDRRDVLERTRKHIATPMRKSSCKRLNMYLRWMVRADDRGVDFGLWKKINPAQLVIPLDLHVGNVARRLQLLTRKNNDWEAAIALTNMLKHFDPTDPVRYDFALFGAGVNP